MAAETGIGQWRVDPAGKHGLRWWDGNGWTDRVSDWGTETLDPLPADYVEPPPRVHPAKVFREPREVRLGLWKYPIILVIVSALGILVARGTGLHQSDRTLNLTADVSAQQAADDACKFHGPWYEKLLAFKGPNTVIVFQLGPTGVPDGPFYQQCSGLGSGSLSQTPP